jgi:hypothetical protein
MESLLKMEDRTAPVDSTQNAQRRRTKNVTRTALFSILFSGNGTPRGGLAAQLMIGLTQPGSRPGATYDFKVQVKGTTAEFSWYRSQGAAGYAIGVYHYDSLENLAPKVYVTKANQLTVTDLPPIPAALGNY